MKISKNDAIDYSREGLTGKYYQMPGVNGGTTVAWAKFTGEHGERMIGEHSRIYYVLRDSAKFVINGGEIEANEGDVVAIPANGTYNFWPLNDFVEVLLVMELLDLDKLPKK